VDSHGGLTQGTLDGRTEPGHSVTFYATDHVDDHIFCHAKDSWKNILTFKLYASNSSCQYIYLSGISAFRFSFHSLLSLFTLPLSSPS
jgi:hypothetical protein